MVSRIYTYRFTPPKEPAGLIAAMAQTGTLVAKHNKWVTGVDMQIDGEDVILKITVQGHDQWWIKKRVIYPLGAILAKHGIKLKDARLLAVDRPEDLRSTRPRASDGRSTPLGEDEMIDHSDMMA